MLRKNPWLGATSHPYQPFVLTGPQISSAGEEYTTLPAHHMRSCEKIILLDVETAMLPTFQESR